MDLCSSSGKKSIQAIRAMINRYFKRKGIAQIREREGLYIVRLMRIPSLATFSPLITNLETSYVSDIGGVQRQIVEPACDRGLKT